MVDDANFKPSVTYLTKVFISLSGASVSDLASSNLHNEHTGGMLQLWDKQGAVILLRKP